MAKKFYFLNSTISLWKRLVACYVLSVSSIINFSYIYVLKVLIIHISFNFHFSFHKISEIRYLLILI